MRELSYPARKSFNKSSGHPTLHAQRTTFAYGQSKLSAYSMSFTRDCLVLAGVMFVLCVCSSEALTHTPYRVKVTGSMIVTNSDDYTFFKEHFDPVHSPRPFAIPDSESLRYARIAEEQFITVDPVRQRVRVDRVSNQPRTGMLHVETQFLLFSKSMDNNASYTIVRAGCSPTCPGNEISVDAELLCATRKKSFDAYTDSADSIDLLWQGGWLPDIFAQLWTSLGSEPVDPILLSFPISPPAHSLYYLDGPARKDWNTTLNGSIVGHLMFWDGGNHYGTEIVHSTWLTGPRRGMLLNTRLSYNFRASMSQAVSAVEANATFSPYQTINASEVHRLFPDEPDNIPMCK